MLRAVQSVDDAKTVVSGKDTVFVSGPGGTWTIKMYKNQRGYCHLNVKGPGGDVMYSVGAVRAALLLNNEVVPQHMDAVDVVPTDVEAPTDVEVPEDTRAVLAATRIQTQYRVHRTDGARRYVREMRAQIAQMHTDLRRLVHHHEQCREHTIMSARAEGSLISRYPSVMLCLPSFSDSIPSIAAPVHQLLSIMTHPMGIDRSDLTRFALQLQASSAKKSRAFDCARALTHTQHYPLIIGRLPLPNIPEFAITETHDRRIYVRSGAYISTDHAIAIKQAFGPKWFDHITDAFTTRSMMAYDFYYDRTFTMYRGSIVVSKFLVRRRGNILPAISIESIVAVHKLSGDGSRMMRFCKRLLFADTLSIYSGYLFAQVIALTPALVLAPAHSLRGVLAVSENRLLGISHEHHPGGESSHSSNVHDVPHRRL